jgi:hypothetical protein
MTSSVVDVVMLVFCRGHGPLWLTENYFEGLEDGWTGGCPPPGDGWDLGSELEKVSKNKKVVKLSFCKKGRPTDVSFPKKVINFLWP